EKVDTLVVDKTGTLTVGRPGLASTVALAPMDESEMLRLAASVERASEHPLADEVVAGADARGLQRSAPHDFRSLTGKGATARVGGRKICVGNSALLNENGVELPAGLISRAEELRRDGQTVMFVAVDGKAAGLIGVADQVKESAAEALSALHAEGVRLAMV